MYKSIDIKNFKCFKSLKIDGLSRINLFCGDNNSGKSTVLEAVHILSKGEDQNAWFDICKGRDARVFDFKYFFHNCDIDQNIIFQSESTGKFSRCASYSMDTKRSEIRQIYDEKPSNDGFEVKLIGKLTVQDKTVDFDVGYKSDSISEALRVPKKLDSFPQDLKISSKLVPASKIKIDNEGLNFIILEARDDDILKIIKKIDSKIKDFRTNIKNANEIWVGHEDISGRIPLNFLGDGTRRFFATAINLYAAKDGVLLVDEIDNGLHWSAMKKLWQTIFEISEMLDVQVFATTHNYDSLQHLKKYLEKNEKYQKDFSLYQLWTKYDGTIAVSNFDFSDISPDGGNETR